MVNQTSCTKSMFDFVHIHIVHTYPQSFPPKLSTSIFIGFSAFSSYTPTYPHYPHFFSVYHQFSPDKEICGSFCTHLINFPFSTKNTRFCLDRLSHPTVVCQPGFKEKKDTQVLSFSVFAHHPSHNPKNAPHFFTDVQIKTF